MKIETLGTSMQNIAVYSSLQRRESENRPIRVGVIGAGATGRAIALQLGTPVPGMRLAGVANRTTATGERSLREAGITDWVSASSPKEAEAAVARGKTVLTDDYTVLTRCDAIDIIIEVTGTVDFAARVVLDAFAQR